MLSTDRPESPITNAGTHNSSQISSAQASSGMKSNINSGEQQLQSKNRICRDFVRGSCRRLHCKYPHVPSSDLVVFCHDFQNNKCPRINCKFLHYNIDEEEYYRKFGEFPVGGGPQQQSQQDTDFISKNGKKINNNIVGVGEYSNDYEYEFGGFFNNSNSSSGNRIPSLLDTDFFHSCQQQQQQHQRLECSVHCHDRGYSNNQNGFRNGLKRINNQGDFLQQPNFKRCREDDLMAVLRRFEEEHLMLKRRVEANELKIAELRASNEYLMTQNAQLRISTVQVSRVVNPVTVTNTQSQQATPAPQVINASMAPVQVATPIVSMTAPPNCNVATPIAIHATNTSQSIGSQQILGTSQITLAPATLTAPSIGLSINTSQALQAAISNANQPIISYPIMTHSILPH